MLTEVVYKLTLRHPEVATATYVFSVSKLVLCRKKASHPEVAAATEGSQSLEIEILRLRLRMTLNMY